MRQLGIGFNLDSCHGVYPSFSAVRRVPYLSKLKTLCPPQFLRAPPLIGRGFDLLLIQHFDEEFERDLLLAVATIDLDEIRDLRTQALAVTFGDLNNRLSVSTVLAPMEEPHINPLRVKKPQIRTRF